MIKQYILAHAVFPLAPSLIFFGIGLIALQAVMKKEIDRQIAAIGAVLTVAGTLCFLKTGTYIPFIAITVMELVLGYLVFRFLHNLTSGIILCLPMLALILRTLARFETSLTNIFKSGWAYVILSFALLGAGLGASLYKGRRIAKAAVENAGGEPGNPE